MHQKDEWMEPREASAALGVHTSKLPNLAIEKMDVRKTGGSKPVWRYNRASVERFKAARTTTVPARLQASAPPEPTIKVVVHTAGSAS